MSRSEEDHPSPITQEEVRKLQVFLDQIGENDHLSQVLREFNEYVDFFNTRQATFLALVFNFQNTFPGLTAQGKNLLIDKAKEFSVEPEKFKETIDRNTSYLVQIPSDQLYWEYTLSGYFGFLNYANYFLDTAALDNEEFGKAAFPRTTNVTLEEVQKAAAKATLLLDVRKSLRTEKTGFSALGILAEERIAAAVQNIGGKNPQKLDACVRGINFFIRDYQRLFSSLATQTATSGVEVGSI